MAARFLVAGGDGLWNSINNWAATSGGASGATAPVAADTVAFDSLSGNAPMTVNVASACLSLIMSGTYAGTLTFDNTLTLTSTVTFVSASTIAGTAGTLALTGGATITSGGKTLTCALSLPQNTIVLADDWVVNGLVTANLTTGSGTLNGVGRKLTCNGGFTKAGTTASMGGTAKLVLTGGTFSSASTGSLTNPVDLQGNVTVSGSIAYAGGPLTYVSGTITTTGSTLTSNAATTFDTNGVTWNNLTFTGAATYTLTSALAWSGTLTLSNTLTVSGAALSGTGAATVSGAFTVTLNNTGGLVTTGTLTLPNAAATFAGSAGFTVGVLTTASLTASRTHTLTFGNTYTVTTTLSNVGTTAAVRQAIVSSVPSSKVVLKLQSGGTADLIYCDPTDVDSSGGTTILTTRGVITTSTNWVTASAASASAGRGALNLCI